MSTTEFLTGKLLIAQPKNQEGHFAKTVVLVAQHSMNGAWGVVVNRTARSLTMSAIMKAAGIESSSDEPIYVGGPVEPTRVHVVHSLDWSSSGTLKITDEIGITGDISVLAAIAANEGPQFYKAGVGLAVWSPGQLDGEMSGKEPWTPKHQWLTVDSSISLCLTGNGDEQWQRAINACVNHRVAELL